MGVTALPVERSSLALIAALGSANGLWPFGVGLQALRYLFFIALAGAALGAVRAVPAQGEANDVDHRNPAWAGVRGLSFLALSHRDDRFRRSTTRRPTSPIRRHSSPCRCARTIWNAIPDRAGRGGRRIPPVERWRALHGEAYPDLKPVRLAMTPDAAIKRAEALVRERGWDVASVDPQAGHLEATATTRFFRFKDDVDRAGAAGRGRQHRRCALGQPGRQERPRHERQEGAQIHRGSGQGLSGGSLGNWPTNARSRCG